MRSRAAPMSLNVTKSFLPKPINTVLLFCEKTPVVNPSFAHRRSRQPSTTHPLRRATVHLIGSNQKVRAIPGDRWERTFRCRFCRARNVYDRLHSRGRQPILPAFSADRGCSRPSFSKSLDAQTVERLRMLTRDFRANRTQHIRRLHRREMVFLA